ncbi:hypothetical protein ACFYZB_00185 [Streptomyces sp. NPDC001852]|uniref:hypothetical protein n=1 Tax=Streptomyces sp. NPDC001852 TaxID=3364619 RepID=UPI0036755ADC
MPDTDERQPGILQAPHARILQADLHRNDAVDTAFRDQPLEGTVVVLAGRGQQYIQVDPGGGVDHAGDEVQLHVCEPLAGRGG